MGELAIMGELMTRKQREPVADPGASRDLGCSLAGGHILKGQNCNTGARY